MVHQSVPKAAPPAELQAMRHDRLRHSVSMSLEYVPWNPLERGSKGIAEP